MSAPPQSMAPPPPSSSTPSSQIELRVRCTDLPDLDVFSKTDCTVLFYEYPIGAVRSQDLLPAGLTLLGQTETVQNSLNPIFSHPLTYQYHFECEQRLRMLLVDVDDAKRASLSHQDIIGWCEATVGQIMSARGQSLSLPIQCARKGGSKKPMLTVSGEEVLVSNDLLNFSLAAVVPKKSLFRRPDPFFRVFRQAVSDAENNSGTNSGQFVAVFDSQIVKNETEPIWLNMHVRVQNWVPSGDLDRPLVLHVYDWEKDGDHKFLGEARLTIREIVDRGMDARMEMRRFALHAESTIGNTTGTGGKKSGSNSNLSGASVGYLQVQSSQLVRVPSFLQFLQAGLQVNLQVGIDFTASNGRITDPGTLHYTANGTQYSQYQHAILSVAPILLDYDTDKQVGVFGFGARLPSGVVSHCWPLGGERETVSGVEGLISSYSLACQHVELYGPTNFSPIIRHVMEPLQRMHGGIPSSIDPGHQNLAGGRELPRVYNILLIITDGEITDMDATVRAIVEASRLPLSIIIVGVGNAGFENMTRLDADEEASAAPPQLSFSANNKPGRQSKKAAAAAGLPPARLRDPESGHCAERDVVQFVPMRDIWAKAGNNPAAAHALLAKEVLAEVPQQVVSYFAARNLSPASFRQ